MIFSLNLRDRDGLLYGVAPVRSWVAIYLAGFQGLPAIGWIIAGVVLLNTAGRMVSTFLALYLASALHFSNGWIGVIVGAYGAGAIGGAFAGGKLCAVLPARTVMILSLVGTGIGFILLSFAEQPLVFVSVLALSGALEGGFRPAMNVVLIQNVSALDRTRCYALYQVALNLGYAFGAALGGFISMIQFSLIFWIDGLTSIVAAAALRLWTQDRRQNVSHEEAREPGGQISPWRDGMFLILILASILYYLVFHQRLSTYPLYLVAHFGFNTAEVGAILAVNSLLIVAGAVFVTDRVKLLDGHIVAALGIFVLCESFAALPIGQSAWLAIGTSVTMTVGEILALPALMSLVYGRATGDRAGEFLGLFFSVNAICRAVAPMLGLWTAASFGETILWAACGLAGLCASGLLCMSYRQRPRHRSAALG